MIKKIILFLSAILLLLVISIYLAVEYQVDQPISLDSPALIKIEQGTTVSSFSRRLVNKGWLTTRFWLRNYIRLNPSLAKLKVGTYQIDAGMSIRDLIALLVAGKEYQFTLTFIEGSTFKQWLELLATEQHITHTLQRFSINQISALLSISSDNPEGWFFPDTYAFTAGTTDLTILKWAHQKMKINLDALWLQRAEELPYQSPYQALIMASIIEKETSQLAEQPLIASVFINRLRKRMRLQTDPTVIYGMGDKYQGNIKRSHLREKTAYNTYRINGLPPTPIAMAGLSSLKAALNPAISDYLYFVSKGNGHHVFSRNLAAHNNAVARYQLGKK